MSVENGSGGAQVTRDVWTGYPVSCDVCRRSIAPTYRHGHWHLPEHPWDDSTECGPCPASGNQVDARPVPKPMSDRIEQTVVEAMPEPHVVPVELQNVPRAEGLDPTKELWT